MAPIGIEYEWQGKLLYAAQPRQIIFHTSQAPNRLYGGAAGGGKTEAILWEAYKISDQHLHMNGAIFRKTFPDIDKYFIRRALEEFPNERFHYSKQSRTMTFLDTGSIIDFNYCQYDNDVYNHQGAEWDWLAIDEVTQHSEYVFKYLTTRLRTNKPGWKPCFFAGSNPGGIGHAYIKRLFIDKQIREGEGAAEDYAFIPAKLADNPALIKADPNYIKRLDALPEYERRKLRDGDWNIFEGQYFDELRESIHSFAPFAYPKHWNLFIALDYGFYPHPASVGWYAADEQGRLWRYRELVAQRQTYKELGARIAAMTPPDEQPRVEYVVASPDIFAQRGHGEGKSGGEEMQDAFDNAKLPWILIPAVNDRVTGWEMLRQYLKPYAGPDSKLTAHLKVNRNCRIWWQTMPVLQHDPHNPDDVWKVGVPSEGELWQGDDAADETRYAVASRFAMAKEPAKRTPLIDRYGAPLVQAGAGVRIERSGRPSPYQGQTATYQGYTTPEP